MSVQLEKVEQNKVKLTVTVGSEQFNKALDEAFKKVSKNVNVPGFRKGKMPRPMFEKRFGVEALYEEAVNYIVSLTYPDAVAEAGIEPVAQPEIDFDFESIGKDKEFVFYATVVVKPEVKLGQYKGLPYEELDQTVTDEEVLAEVNKLLEKEAELVVKETEAQLGDTVVIDYEGLKDGVPFDGGTATNHSLKLGSNSFIPGFEEQLVGVKANESRDINVTFPEEYQAADLAGAPVVFKVTCHEVKGRELPELNDEFVKELNHGDVSTVEELKADLREHLLEHKATEAKNHKVDSIVDLAANNAEINLPQEMIDAEADRMLHETEQRLQQQYQGMTLDLYLQVTGGTKEGLLETLKDQSAKRLRYNLTLEQISKEENIQVTEEDLEKEYAQMANVYKMPIEEIKKYIPDASALVPDLKVRKAVDLLVETAVKK
ncbi:MAG: tiG [Haloplasmataceae bacterium]|jgi:trigger factor|nr:tiG [Haloplasmataceae bacterium]